MPSPWPTHLTWYSGIAEVMSFLQDPGQTGLLLICGLQRFTGSREGRGYYIVISVLPDTCVTILYYIVDTCVTTLHYIIS